MGTDKSIKNDIVTKMDKLKLQKCCCLQSDSGNEPSILVMRSHSKNIRILFTTEWVNVLVFQRKKINPNKNFITFLEEVIKWKYFYFYLTKCRCPLSAHPSLSPSLSLSLSLSVCLSL